MSITERLFSRLAPRISLCWAEGRINYRNGSSRDFTVDNNGVEFVSPTDLRIIDDRRMRQTRLGLWRSAFLATDSIGPAVADGTTQTIPVPDNAVVESVTISSHSGPMPRRRP